MVLSADHIRAFLTIVEKGSFSAAAKTLGRGQTTISYAIATLEQQLGTKLFERTRSRPVLTAAGAALVADAQKVSQSIDALKSRARAVAQGIEPDLTISIDNYAPPEIFTPVLRDFASAFPDVGLTLHQESVGQARDRVLQGDAALGIISDVQSRRQEFRSFKLGKSVKLIPVVVRGHPLAAFAKELHHDALSGFVQIVSILHLDSEYGAFSPRLWHCNSLPIHRAALLAGVGWSAMPEHLALPDIEAGLIERINIAGWEDPMRSGFELTLIHLFDATLGPAAKWLIEEFSTLPG